MSWSRPRSPVTIVVGRPLAWAAPIPEEISPSIPLAPRLQRKSTSAVRGAEERLLVPDRHRGGGVDEVAVAVGSPERQVQRRLGELVGSAQRRRRSRRAPSAPRPRATPPERGGLRRPPRVRAAPPSRAAHSVGSARRITAGAPVGSFQPPARVDDDLVGAARREPLAQRLARSAARRSAAPARGRRRAPSARRAAGCRRWRRRRSGRGGRGASARSARRGSGSPSRGRGGREARAAPGRSGGRRRSRRRSRRRCGPATSSRMNCGGLEVDAGRPRSAARPPRPCEGQRVGRGHRALDRDRRERLAPGQVEVDGAGPDLAARPRRAPGRRPSAVQQARVVGVVGADFAEPAHRFAEGLDLVDRLPGADPAQLRAAGRRSARSAAAPIRRPRRPPGGSSRAPSPRCRAAPPARRSPARRRGRRRRRSARRRSPSPRSPARARAPPPAASSASPARRPPAAARRAPTPRQRPRRERYWHWSGPCCGEKVALCATKAPRQPQSRWRCKRILVDLDAEPGPWGLVQEVALELALGRRRSSRRRAAGWRGRAQPFARRSRGESSHSASRREIAIPTGPSRALAT